MRTAINFGEYVLPLSVGKRVSELEIKLLRFAGASYFLRANGLIATCGHIVDELAADEVLVAQDLVSGGKGEVAVVRRHPKYDFAVCYFHNRGSPKVLEHYPDSTLLGLDIQAFGFTADGASGRDLKILPRLFKGSIVGHGHRSTVAGARSTLELSFPALKGFSGAPLFTSDNGPQLAGMIYGNHESTIEQYAYTEIVDSDRVLTERVHKIIELGLAHTPADIRHFLTDLAIPELT